MYTELSGATVAQYYAADKTIGIQLRLQDSDRNDLAKIKSLPVYVGPAGYVPLEQIATISYKGEDGLIWRRDLKPTITINGGIKSGTANDATQKAYDSIADIRESMPFGYTVEVDGALENSQKSLKYLMVLTTGLGADFPRPQRAVLDMVSESSSNSSMSPSTPLPLTILSRISSILLVPSRHGTHFPQDSF